MQWHWHSCQNNKEIPQHKPLGDSRIQTKKYKAFANDNLNDLKLANREVKNAVFKAKLKYKDKLEREFSNMNTKQAFQKVQTLTGCSPKPSTVTTMDPVQFVGELNDF